RSPFRDFVHLKVLRNAKHFAKPPGVIGNFKKPPQNKMIRNLIAIISTIGIIIWMVTDFYGGMFIYFLSYPYLVFPIILLYIFSFFETFVSLIRNGFKKNIIKVVFHSFLITIIIIFNLLNLE